MLGFRPLGFRAPRDGELAAAFVVVEVRDAERFRAGEVDAKEAERFRAGEEGCRGRPGGKALQGDPGLSTGCAADEAAVALRGRRSGKGEAGGCGDGAETAAAAPLPRTPASPAPEIRVANAAAPAAAVPP